MSSGGSSRRLSPEEIHRQQQPATSAAEVAADLAASRAIDLDLSRVVSVGLIVGPYRNLTTLTASLLALHPSCQVLNHAGVRIPAEVNFIASPERERLEGFIRYAVHISSTSGAYGASGASIRESHAFGREPLRSRYEARYGAEDRKSDIRCVLWKESMWVTRRLRAATDLETLLDALPSLRLLLPIRNPLDCTASNAKLGMAETLGATVDAELDIMDAVLDIIAWFLDWERRRPDRFTHIWQEEFDAGRFASLGGFLSLDPDARWLADVADCCHLSGGYDHDPALVARYREQITRRFAHHPDARDRLLAFMG